MMTQTRRAKYTSIRQHNGPIDITTISYTFWATVCKTVRPMLSDRCLSSLSVCLSVCNVGVLWPNGSTDQDETWHAGRPRPWPHCIRWGPSSPSPKGHNPQFSAHIRCGQMAAYIKILLGMEVGFGPGRLCVRWGPRSPSPKRGRSPPPKKK